MAHAEARLQEAGFLSAINADAHDPVLARQATDPRSRGRGREDAADPALGADPGQTAQIRDDDRRADDLGWRLRDRAEPPEGAGGSGPSLQGRLARRGDGHG